MLSDVEQLLRSLRQKSAVYIPNRGNAGDSFIQHATYQLFDRVGLDYEIGNQAGTYPGRTVIFAGGGNLVRPYRNGIDFLNRNLGQWRELVLLPHTIRDYEDTLTQFGSNCFIFCREMPSFEFVKRSAPRANVFLSHDVAVTCDFDETRRQMAVRGRTDLLNLQLLMRNAKRLVRAINYEATNLHRSNVLNAFRTDIEKTALEIPKPNIDVSNGFAADDMLPLASLHATYWMVRFIERFQTVRTNRLHVGILSMMLGKDVQFYDNAYGKNQDVFDHSLRDRFTNVRWSLDLSSAES